MKATELFLADGRPAKVWFCSECRCVAKDRDIAERCCNVRCEECESLIGKGQQFSLKCPQCKRKEYERREAERIERAEVVDDWDGWVFVDGPGYQDGYFADVGVLLEYCEDEGVDPPDFALCCKAQVLKARIEDLLEPLDAEGWEDMTEHAKGYKSLSEAIDEFNAVNADVFVVWHPDYTRKVAVPRPVAG